MFATKVLFRWLSSTASRMKLFAMFALGAFLVGTLLSAQTVQFIAGPHLTLSVGAGPVAVAINPSATTAYVVNATAHTVSVINTGSNTLVTTIPVGASPDSVAVNPAGTLVYVANATDNTVSVIDAATNLVTATIPGFSKPSSVAFSPSDPAGTYAYVTNSTGNNVFVIATSTNTVAATIPVGNGPQAIAVNAAGTYAYVANYTDNTVSVVSLATNTVTGSAIPVGAHPDAIAFNMAGTFAYVANFSDNTVSVINLATNTVTGSAIPVGNGPQAIVVNPVGTFVYTANYSSNTVSVIDTTSNTVIATPTASFAPDALAVSPTGTFGYVVNAGGSVYEVTLVAAKFESEPVITPTAVQTLTFSIPANTTVGGIQILTLGSPALEFAYAANAGTCAPKTYASATSCTVNVIFTPAFPGQRMGGIVFSDANGVTLRSTLLFGMGTGPEIGFSPGVASASSPVAVAGGSAAQVHGIALDGAGDVYVADQGNDRIVELPASGGVAKATVLYVGTPGGIALGSVDGVAVDGGGTVYIADTGNLRIVKVPPYSGSTSGGTAGVLGVNGVGAIDPSGVAVDGAGDVFISDLNNRVIEVSSTGVASVLSTGSLSLNQPFGVAVDAAGDVFVADLNNNRVVEIAANGNASVLSTGSLTLNMPSGVAVDAAGDVYIDDTGNSRVIEISSTGTASVLNTGSPNGTALDSPQAVALDGAGDVYIADVGNGRIVELAQGQPSSLTFATATIAGNADTIDGSETTTVENLGNEALVFSTPTSGTNPSYALNFPENGANANLCAASASLSMGATCDVSANFSPTIGGALTGSVVLTDNSLNAVAPNYVAQSIALSGTAWGSTVPQLSFTPALSSQMYGAAIGAGVLDATASYNGSALAGTFTYMATAGSSQPAAVNAGSILAVGTYVITATFIPTDAVDYQPASVTAGYSVTQASDVTSLTVSNSTVNPGSTVTLTAQVASAASGYPTGTVSFLDNGTLLGTAPLAAGSATYTTSTLTAATTHNITATYSGDVDFLTSTSTAATVTVGALDFTMSVEGASTQSVAAGSTATYQLAVKPLYGNYAAMVSFAVTGLPTGATATFSPSSIAANGGAQTVSIAIQTAATTARMDSMPRPADGGKKAPLAFAILLLLGVGSMRKRARVFRSMLCVAILVLCGSMVALIGCGGGSGGSKNGTGTTPPPENYTLTITATSGALHHASTVTLTVQ
jgi:YVTN family beta-propeller protein